MQQIEKGKVNITHPEMTRFWLKIDDAIQFVTSDEHDRNADVLIHPKIKAAKVVDLVAAIAHVMRMSYDINITGIRPGEKIHEHLKSDHDSCIRSDTAERYSFDELCGLVGFTVTEYYLNKA
jgi:FlaA1/EpsC-like NDP-sugar epimerase